MSQSYLESMNEAKAKKDLVELLEIQLADATDESNAASGTPAAMLEELQHVVDGAIENVMDGTITVAQMASVLTEVVYFNGLEMSDDVDLSAIIGAKLEEVA